MINVPILILLFLFFFNNCNAQVNQNETPSPQIIYKLPANINLSITENMEFSSSLNYSCNLTVLNDTITLVIETYRRKIPDKMNNLFRSTNRFIFIEEIYIPVIFRSDYLFSNLINTNTQYDKIEVTESITHTLSGFYIKFTYNPGNIEGDIVDKGFIH